MQNAKNISGNKGGQRKKKVMIKQAGELEISRGQVRVETLRLYTYIGL